MKAEHRKELHTNLLADRLAKMLESVKSGPRSSSVVIWVGLGLIVLTVFVWWIYSRKAVESRSDVWRQIDAALHNPSGGEGKLSELAREHRGTLPGRIARFQLARRNLQEGVRIIPDDLRRQEAVEKLTKARDEFTQLAGECVDDPLLGAEALMNQARAEEALAGIPSPEDASKGLGDLERALAAYRQVVAKYPNSARAEMARERIKTYEDENQRRDLEQFYARLRQEFDRKVTPPPGT